MSFFSLFSSPSSEKIEQKGDRLFEAGHWGKAKIELERALHKLENANIADPEGQKRLKGKIVQTKEALAEKHHRDALNYIEGGYYEEAAGMIRLALDMTGDASILATLENLLQKTEDMKEKEYNETLDDDFYGLSEDPVEETAVALSSEEQFLALCGTLPPELQAAYQRYDEDFRIGYIALNSGDFQTAATHLSLAMAAEETPGTYIPLELATAYLHLGKSEEARELLMPFLSKHPDTLPAYQLLCEIYWDNKEFEKVEALLAAIPEDLAGTVPVILLRGETLYRSGDFEATKTFYLGVMKTYEWNDDIAKALAKTYETLGASKNALNIYRELMAHCTSCRTRIEPEIKHQYAELSYSAGIHDTNTLELYLSLARELPQNAQGYYEKVSQIYKTLGNDTEAARFRSIAKKQAN